MEPKKSITMLTLKKGSCYISISRNRLEDRILSTGPAEIHDAILL
jgi:hypothetical protein